jgi:tetratricopeptide (TPR) repeat protein
MSRALTLSLILSTCVMASAAWAVDSGEDSPPTPTETTTVCEEGMVWNPETELCEVPTEESGLSDDLLYEAAREFAYAGQHENAWRALTAMSDQTDDRVLTYRGFLTRSMGDMAGGMAYYAAALAANPDNLLARSYMGQAYVLMGDLEQARVQLEEIGARGGKDSWPELALIEAIENPGSSVY